MRGYYKLHGSIGIGLVLLAIGGTACLTSESERTLAASAPENGYSSGLTPQETFVRTQAIYKYFGVPASGTPDGFFDRVSGLQTVTGIRQILPFLDPNSIFSHYFRIEGDFLIAYKDAGALLIKDFSIPLASGPIPEDRQDFIQNLRRAKLNPATQPLAGLKIALDPGHMGSELWDIRTGKFIRDDQGRKISEGVIALQTAILLETELRALGAEVRLTRRALGPVTSLAYDNFEIRDYGLRQLKQSSLHPWFQRLLEVAPAGPQLFAAFEASLDFQRLFSEKMRSQYFLSGADLLARIDAIDQFKPDITLIIHYDVRVPNGKPNGINPRGYNGTKAFIVGGMLPTEFASEEDRRHFARHLANPTEWTASLKLSRSVVGALHDQLDLPYDSQTGNNSTLIEPGIISRNLGIPRRLTGSATAYLECLFYNDPAEFEALSDTKYPLVINGESLPYSERLAQVVQAIRDGILNFVSSY